MKFSISKEWLISRAHLEEGCEIGAGSLHEAGYAAWWIEVKARGKELGWSNEALASLDEAAWREHYFAAGMTPTEAWRAEYEAA